MQARQARSIESKLLPFQKEFFRTNHLFAFDAACFITFHFQDCRDETV
jgi:hypothetical protein